MIDERLSLAPMMEISDMHFRYFLRGLSKKTVLYTEMVVDDTINHSPNLDFLLGKNIEEYPSVIQLGGHNAETLANATEIVNQYGNYSEINLNCGCPSQRVSKRCFGAKLMEEPEYVREIVYSMQRRTDRPVTVKCRIGVDQKDSYEELCHFIRECHLGGVNKFIIHSRKCFLKGLSTKQNRDIPPLKYEVVHRLVRDFPDLVFILNGGITDFTQAQSHLNNSNNNNDGDDEVSPWMYKSEIELQKERQQQQLLMEQYKQQRSEQKQQEQQQQQSISGTDTITPPSSSSPIVMTHSMRRRNKKAATKNALMNNHDITNDADNGSDNNNGTAILSTNEFDYEEIKIYDINKNNNNNVNDNININSNNTKNNDVTNKLIPNNSLNVCPSSSSSIAFTNTTAASTVVNYYSDGNDNNDNDYINLQPVHGIMIGRAIYNNPLLLANADSTFFHTPNMKITRRDVLERYIQYCEYCQSDQGPRKFASMTNDVYMASTSILLKPVHSIMNGLRYSPKYKQMLNDLYVTRVKSGIMNPSCREVIEGALECIADEDLDRYIISSNNSSNSDNSIS